MNYDLEQPPSNVSAYELGQRAARLRNWLGLSVAEVAQQTGLAGKDIERFEETGEGTIELLLALSEFLSSGEDVGRLFQTPKFTSLDQVTAFETRRVSQ